MLPPLQLYKTILYNLMMEAADSSETSVYCRPKSARPQNAVLQNTVTFK